MTQYHGSQDDKIKHVVLLCLENRSFDQALGGMQAEMPDLDGVDPKGAPRRNKVDGVFYEQIAIYDKQIGFDPKHEYDNTVAQLKDGAGGFLSDFTAAHPAASEQDRFHLLGFYPAGFLPATHTLARHFAVCDRWFASVPGPTWPNRLFLLSGTTKGKIHMPEGKKHLGMVGTQNQPTIFDRLNEKKKKWKVYYHDLASSLLLVNQLKGENFGQYFKFDQFAEDAKDEATFPEFSFIEPRYYGKDQNDDHPPHNTMKAQKLIADIYNTLRGNEKLWESTLFIVVYDEHGGFYDHVEPPKAVPPGEYAEHEYTFDQLGVRVPALLVSPWVKKGVEHTVFDHTSVLRYLIDKWDLKDLGKRTEAANSIECALQFDAPLTDIPQKITVTEDQLHTPRPELEDDAVSSHNQALIHLMGVVKSELAEQLIDNIALSQRDPRVFKKRWYPVLAVLGDGLKAVGKWLTRRGEKLSAFAKKLEQEELALAAKEMDALVAAKAAVAAKALAESPEEMPLVAAPTKETEKKL